MKKTTVLVVSISCFLIAIAMVFAFGGCASSAAKTYTPQPPPEWGPHLAPEMVWVPGGTYLMGSNDPLDLDAKPVHAVTVDGFYMAKYLVTQLQYHAVMGFNPSLYQGGVGQPRDTVNYDRADLPPGLANSNKLPVEQVTWFDVIEFCNKLSALEGRGTMSHSGASLVRVAFRDYYFPSWMMGLCGFRVVRGH